MTHEEAFLAAIIAAPEDDAPRLIFADWLAEHGQEERAEFIRVQCALHQLTAGGFIVDEPAIQDDVDALRRREWELVGLSPSWPLLTGVPYFGAKWTFRRGFIEVIECTANAWLEHADALTRAAPIREVALTTWPEAETRPIFDGGMDKIPTGEYVSRVQAGGREVWHNTEEPTHDDLLKLLAAEWPRIKFTLPIYGESMLRRAYRDWREVRSLNPPAAFDPQQDL